MPDVSYACMTTSSKFQNVGFFRELLGLGTEKVLLMLEVFAHGLEKSMGEDRVGIHGFDARRIRDDDVLVYAYAALEYRSLEVWMVIPLRAEHGMNDRR